MKLTGQFEFIGIENITGKKDPTKTFHNVALMQGVDVVKVFINDDTMKQFDGIKKMDKISCDLTISISSDRSYVGIDAVRKI
ncbi:MAG: hypothetical protein K0S61_4876 [Anaerocolumna sp.]|jgi:hypothetical protein|nr:hypothetical protein [Anaerocolumna sp.]